LPTFDGSSEVAYLSDEFDQANPHVLAVAPDGDVWVAMNDWQPRTGEIFRLRDGGWGGIESDRAAFHSVERIVIGQDGVVWIAHGEGITRIEPSSQD
jgi:streptogramin lyase